MSPTDNSWQSDSPADQRSWRPLSLMNVFAAADYRVFVLASLWIGITAVCVWWPIANFDKPGFGWNDWQMTVAGVHLDITFYLPWTVCVCLIMWLGFEWAACTAYLATLFSTLHKGMPVDFALVNALHNPLAMAVFFLFYCNFKSGYDLRSIRSWGWFVTATLVASLVSSFGALISQFTGTPIGAQGFLSAWLGWWPNAFVQTLLTSAPLIFLLSPRVELLKQRYFPLGRAKPFSQQELLMAASMFALTLVLLILASDQWQAGRTQALLSMSIPDAARTNILNQLSIQRLLAWLLALLLAAISLGGVFFTSRWAKRMRARFDSETRLARDALRRSEANFRNFFENNPAPMMLYDREDGEFVDVNRAAMERYGYTHGEFMGMTIFDIQPPEKVPKFKTYLRELIRSRDEHHYAGEWRHLTKSGEILYVEVRVSALVIDNRAMYLALVHDVSPRKQAQAAVERRARELQQLAASSLQITGVLTVEEVLQTTADRARELSGARFAMAQSWPGQSGLPIALRVAFSAEYAAWWDLQALPKTTGIFHLLAEKQYPLRLTAQQLDAHPEYLHLSGQVDRQPPLRGLLAIPLTNSDTEIVGVLMVSAKENAEFDVEDEAILVQLTQIASAGIESVRLKMVLQKHMQELEERVTERTAELDASNRELDAFAYSVAHDLRAPLRAMHGFADALLEDYTGKLDDAGRDYLNRIIKGSKNMDTLIQDLLAYSRIGREKAVLQGVALADLVQDVVSDLQHEIEARGARLDVAVPPLTVLAHKATLKQVLLNLVNNALKFVRPGQAPQVRIWAVARRGMVELCVRDNGIGIAPEHQQRIFNVFERLHGAESYPGTGIGLSIVKKGLASMQGEIYVESGANGSTFHARLKEYRDG